MLCNIEGKSPGYPASAILQLSLCREEGEELNLGRDGSEVAKSGHVFGLVAAYVRRRVSIGRVRCRCAGSYFRHLNDEWSFDWHLEQL